MGRGHHPGYLDKVNGIIDFIENPCDAPWFVYLELAQKPAFKVVIQLVATDLTDIVRGYFRPKGLRIGGHMRRKGRKGGRRGRGIPDTAELIAHHIPGHDAVAGRKISDGVRHLWLIDGAIQRVFWYWMVVDLTLDFFYEWTSAVNASEYCREEPVGYCTITGGGNGIIGGHWQNFGSDEEVVQRGSCIYTGLTSISHPGGLTVGGIRRISGGTFGWDGAVTSVLDFGHGKYGAFAAVQGVHDTLLPGPYEYEFGILPFGAGAWSSGPISVQEGAGRHDGVSPCVRGHY
jgi:hypothetical protein